MKRTLALAVLLASMIAGTATGAARPPGFYWQHVACTYKSGVVTCTNLGPTVATFTRNWVTLGPRGHARRMKQMNPAYGTPVNPASYRGVLCTLKTFDYSNFDPDVVKRSISEGWPPAGTYVWCGPDGPHGQFGTEVFIGNTNMYLRPS